MPPLFSQNLQPKMTTSRPMPQHQHPGVTPSRSANNTQSLWLRGRESRYEGRELLCFGKFQWMINAVHTMAYYGFLFNQYLIYFLKIDIFCKCMFVECGLLRYGNFELDGKTCAFLCSISKIKSMPQRPLQEHYLTSIVWHCYIQIQCKLDWISNLSYVSRTIKAICQLSVV